MPVRDKRSQAEPGDQGDVASNIIQEPEQWRPGKESPIQVIDPAFEPGVFVAALAQARQTALFLDYDGTLAPFRVERQQAIPYPGVRGLLVALNEAAGTRLVLISGRATADLLPLLALPRPPEIWGCHGWERLLPDGRYKVGDIGLPARQGLMKAQAWLERNDLAPHCEVKPVSVALHWRGMPSEVAEAMGQQARSYWTAIAHESGLRIHQFDGGLELRVPGRDKGVVLDRLLSELPAGTPAVFLGDDRTDEDAFRAMKGRGVAVLVRSERRATAADLWLRPPAELLEFLGNWLIMTLGADVDPAALFAFKRI